MTYVLLTRPQEDCQELAKKLIVPVISSPLLIVKQTLKQVKLPKGVTDLIVTSARVFEMVANIKSMTSTPVWCVGEATAAAAKAAGFETIFQVNRSAHEILEHIVKECPKDSSHFAHICGSVVYVDLADALTKLGYKADKIVIYEVDAAHSLTPEAEKIMRAGLIHQVPFFSLRTAEVFVEIAKKSEWADEIPKITALAHSEAIARCLRQLHWKEVIVVPGLSADRITEYYKRPGDYSMKHGSFVKQLLLATIIVGAVSVLTVALWPKPAQEATIEIVQTQLQSLMQDINTLKDRLQQVPTLKEENEKLNERLASLQEAFTTYTSEHSSSSSTPASSIATERHEPQSGAVPVAEVTFKALYEDFLKGSVKPEAIISVNKQLSEKQQLPASVLSVRDLLDQLQLLPDLKRETNVQVKDSLSRKAMDFIGLKIRRTEATSLKEDAAKALKTGDFSFLSAFKGMVLPSAWAAWIKDCSQTKNALQIIRDHMEQGSAKAEEEHK
ncbi:uroporphyrinogen-III synthase [Candidatus Odyssella thessalonicensis]|uniref:uroporphyrinogen-III synthase n=1 Tax=Candidatus Odyssella thessalonicensis TaxID=84647 RepID=UPI000225C0A7|nr:uroporphyrinogen-III synthase [Candidatus Odyssella thessalonicensis]